MAASWGGSRPPVRCSLVFARRARKNQVVPFLLKEQASMGATPVFSSRRPRRWWGGLLVACVASMTAGCAVNPVSGRPEVAVLSADKERELGGEEAKKVEASMGLVADPALLAFVRSEEHTSELQ